MEFKEFAAKVTAQFNEMAKHDLYVVDIAKDAVWDMYLDSFPQGTNDIYIERTEHDCNHCKQFIRHIGNVVAIIDNKLVSVWDVTVDAEYDIVTNVLSDFIKSSDIKDIFIHFESKVSRPTSPQLLANGSVKTWDHLHCEVPAKFVNRDMATQLAKVRQTKEVYERGLNELSLSASEMVLDLIDSNAIYRGAEHKDVITNFLKLQEPYLKLNDDQAKNIYCWNTCKVHGARIKNTVIGSLLEDISKGVELTTAVKSFEAKVAPSNYKRTTALVTEGMIKTALKTIDELGIRDALPRRYAVSTDLSINNVLFADRSLSMLDQDPLEAILMASTKSKEKSYDNAPEISIEDFMSNVVPKVNSIEVLLENSHTSNLVSLIAPENADAPDILQWDNNFSWSYNGEITDSMKERVKAAGGKVDGVLRFSLQWNDGRNDQSNDLDAHCVEPNNNRIYFSSPHSHLTNGRLDVDIQRPGSKTAVENITWPTLSKMQNGKYLFRVHNYSGRNTDGFTAEIEFNGEIHSFSYNQSATGYTDVAEVTLTNGVFTINPILPSSTASKDAWGIATQKFHKVSTMLLSPNHWDEQSIGNKHYFFMIDTCLNPEGTRGLYNEFLKGSLTPHRKVFEMLGSKVKCPASEHQLSGLGFSSTQSNELICKVSGDVTKVYKVKF